MTRIRYTMPARSQGKLYTQRAMAELVEKDAHRWVLVYGMAPDVEFSVRKWLSQRLDDFYCDLQAMYTPHVTGPTPARTHIVLNAAPPLHTMAENDEAVEVDARGLDALDVVRAIIKATGLNQHLLVCGWPFCLSELDRNENENEGGAA